MPGENYGGQMLTLDVTIKKVSSANEHGCLRLTIDTQELGQCPEKIAMLHLLKDLNVTATFGKGDENEEVAPQDSINP